jgi:hypothetical protein
VFSICGNSFKTFGKLFQVKLVERMPRLCNAVIKAKGGYCQKNSIGRETVDSFRKQFDRILKNKQSITTTK